MAVNVNCPGCRTSYPVTEDLLGKTIRCKKCQETFTARAAKSAVATRAPDERITTRAPAKGRNGHYDDDEDDNPRRNGNGRARPMAKRPPAKSGGNKGLLIGGIAGGVLLLAVGVGVGLWAFGNKDDSGSDNNSTASTSTPVISTGASTTSVKPVVDPTPDPKAEKTASATGHEMKTGDVPDKFVVVRQARPADIRPETVMRVQKSAAYITCHMAEGLAWGSGWVAERHGNVAYVITNSHVVGMKEPAAPPPEKVDVCFDAGEANERHYDGKILALDRVEDLCVLQVKGKDLPAPLKLSPSDDLVPSQRITTMGFPQGEMLKMGAERGLGTGPLKTSLRTRPSTVSGRMFHKDGAVKYISAEGGVDGGNSGGAVVDSNGNVCCVVVAGSTVTNMRFFIPSEYVVHLLLGRLLKVIPGQAIGSPGAVRQPLVATIADPLKRLRKVDADVWAGAKPDLKAGERPVRPGGDREPEPKPGDGPRATGSLAYDPNHRLKLGDAFTATGEIILPAVQDNQVYWFQPHYFATDGSERWGEAIVLDMGRYPVDAKPAHLEMQLAPDHTATNGHPLEIDSHQAFNYQVEGLGGDGSDLGLVAKLTERVTLVDKNGDATVRLQYQDLRPSDSLTESQIRRQYKGVLEQAKRLRTTVTVNKNGRWVPHQLEDVEVNSQARPFLRQFNQQIIASLESMALSLPNKDVQPGDTWNHESAFTFNLERNVQNVIYKMNCKYVGSRVRDGREEAVIEITGRAERNSSSNGQNQSGRAGPGGRQPEVRPNPGGPNDSGDDDQTDGKKLGLSGLIHGAAIVDIATGEVTLGRTEAEMAVGFPASFPNPRDPQHPTTVNVFAGLYQDVTLRRSLTKSPPKELEVSALLPNQPRDYRPLVGVGVPEPEVVAPSVPLTPERNALMPPDVADRVQHSAVMLQIQRRDGPSEGSGWFAGPGIVMTTAHVVGMLTKADRPPEKITVYVDAGTDKERRLSGELMSVNREDDLALIRVKGDNLPVPLKTSSSANLIAATRLAILGFPQGTTLAKGLELGLGLANRDIQTTILARPTTVTGVLAKANGGIKFITLEGGADEGNFGGAVVDAKGEVRAVVSGSANKSEIRYAIPSEYASRMIDGYPLEVVAQRAYMDGSTPKEPVEVRFCDPLDRLAAVSIDYWVGNNGKPRKATSSNPKSSPGDGPRKTLTLSLKPGNQPGERAAVGEFVLPALGAGQVCWLQPRFTNGTGKEQWSPGIVYAPDGPPVERKPATLAVKFHPKTSRDVDLVSFTKLYDRKLGSETSEGMPLKVSLKENVLAKSARGTATIQLVYEKLELDLKTIFPVLNDEEVPREVETAIAQQLRPFLNLIRGVITLVHVTKDGQMKVVRGGVSYAKLPAGAWIQMDKFNSQILASLQALTFPLPDKQVPYGHTWDFKTDLFIASQNKSDGAAFKMQFKYEGVRERGGRQEALIAITGSLVDKPNAKGLDETDGKDEAAAESDKDKGKSKEAGPSDATAKPAANGPKPRKKGLYGVARGYAVIDLSAGFVSEVKLFIDLDMEVMQKDRETKQDLPIDAGGTMELHLTRRQASK